MTVGAAVGPKTGQQQAPSNANYAILAHTLEADEWVVISEDVRFKAGPITRTIPAGEILTRYSDLDGGRVFCALPTRVTRLLDGRQVRFIEDVRNNSVPCFIDRDGDDRLDGVARPQASQGRFWMLAGWTVHPLDKGSSFRKGRTEERPFAAFNVALVMIPTVGYCLCTRVEFSSGFVGGYAPIFKPTVNDGPASATLGRMKIDIAGFDKGQFSYTIVSTLEGAPFPIGAD